MAAKPKSDTKPQELQNAERERESSSKRCHLVWIKEEALNNNKYMMIAMWERLHEREREKRERGLQEWK